MSEEEQPPKRLSPRELYSRYGASLVAVVTVDESGDEHIGSAFHVGEGTFVTARHVVEGQVSCGIELDTYRLFRLATDAWKQLLEETKQVPTAAKHVFPFQPHVHPDPTKDVAVFSIPALAKLPAIPLGDHLDDWVGDHDFVLSEVLVLGFPPIPLSQRNVLVASQGHVNATVDLMNVKHVHFIVSVTARGGLSGGVVLTEMGSALGVVTSSLTKNGLAEELGYLTVLTVEPILECLAMHGLLPRVLALEWDGLFTASKEYFGVPEKSWAHSWIETDRDGHRSRLTFATPDPAVVSTALIRIAGLADFRAKYQVLHVDVHVWELETDYSLSEEPLERARVALRQVLLDSGYLPVESPTYFHRMLEPPPVNLTAPDETD